MIRDLVETAVDMVRIERLGEVAETAERNAEERILDILIASLRPMPGENSDGSPRKVLEIVERTRETLRKQLRGGRLDAQMIELEVKEHPMAPFAFQVFESASMEEVQFNMKDMLSGMMEAKPKKRRMRVDEALDYLEQEEEQKLVDMEQVARIALDRVEDNGIIFLDEIDKIAGRESGHGPDVSREGVQRDILPIVEGTTVNTRYGVVRTDHILFIAAGAFHISKPSDLIPELQGRFPIRVEMKTLTEGDFVRILCEPQNALIKQYVAMLRTEGVTLKFSEDAIRQIARMACTVNDNSENIGARRLHTVMEAPLDDIMFKGSELPKKHVRINADYVNQKLKDIVADKDTSRYIL
jgi:ATP-dependent HslUV protease ATP-binding subunit HslU